MRRFRLTYANVVSTMALVLALGGGAYAGTSLSDTEGPAPRAAGALPSGKTERGVFNVSGMQATGATQNMQLEAVTFPQRLNFTPVGHVLGPSETTAACQGTVSKPSAKPGHLCIYYGGGWSQGSVVFVDPRTQASAGVTPCGFVLGTSPYITSSSFSFNVHGTWAVTAK